MKVIIHSRRGVASYGLKRYKGHGIFSTIARKLFSSGVRKVINAASKSNLPQKLADVVVNGAQSGGKSLGKLAGKKLVQVISKKRSSQNNPLIEEGSNKKTKLDINRIINGSGIIKE